MKFRWFVGACLALMTYGVLYSNLPCWAQLLDKTMYCQIQASGEAEQARQAAWEKLSPAEQKRQWELYRERRVQQNAAEAAAVKGMVQDAIKGEELSRKRGQ